MKIEKTKPKKNISEVPPMTKEMISRLLTCSEDELVELLKSTVVWRFGKCELYHWIDLLDRFDLILEQAAQEADESKKAAKVEEHDTSCIFMCPRLDDPQFKEKIVTVLNFTALLIEHSYARHIYNSTEHLCVLLACPDLDVVLAVLNLLYVFSKRSNFISRLSLKKRTQLNSYLEYLGESWGGKQNGFGLAQCCSNAKKSAFPESCTSVYFEYQPAEKPQDAQAVLTFKHVISWLNPYWRTAWLKAPPPQMSAVTESILLHSVDQMEESLPVLMAQLTASRRIPQVNQMQLLSRIRLAKHFSSPAHRRKCVMARLQAISILVYSMGPPEVVDPLIYDGLVEELVEVLEIKGSDIVEIKAAVLRTITAIIHLERDPRLSTIIDATGAATYHGFLPSLVRDCVATFTSPPDSTAGAATGGAGTSSVVEENSEFPLSFATALFSFLYHLATYEASGDALVTSGIMKALLQVLEWKAYEPTNITLVTRAVRVIDLITMLDMSAFHSQGGWNKMLDRLEHEVSFCSREVKGILPSELKPKKKKQEPSASSQGAEGSNEEQAEARSYSADDVALVCYEETPMDAGGEDMDATLQPADVPQAMEEETGGGVRGVQAGEGGDEGCGCVCMPERAALIKSILNFLKKAIPEPTLAENIRTFVDSSLPRSLKHIISNAEYYGPSIYLPATEVTTAFIFHEPSQLSALQDNGLPGVVLNSIITKPIPITREVLSSLPNILSAMCLNARGLQEFIAAEPFDHLFGVLISPGYLPAMRKKKGADSTGDTASNLGVAMDELMRHQPTLRVSVITALIRLLERLIEMGHMIPEEGGAQSTKVGGGDKGESSSPAATASADSSANAGTEEGRRMSMSANPSQEEHLDMGSDHEDAEDIDLDDDESTDGDEDDGKGDGTREHRASSESVRDGKSNPPLGEYIVNVVHFLDSILSNNSTDDHMREFISQGGLRPLLKILSLPVLSLDFPLSSACQAIAGPCRSILHIAHSEELLVESLTQLSALLSDLGPFLRSPLDASNSVLLQEVGPLSNVAQAIKSPTKTPILHKLVAVNAFIQLFVNLSRSCQASYNVESRLLCINRWSSELGRSVLQQISELYRALVWEGFILLAVAAEEDRSVQPSDAAGSTDQTDSQTKEPIPEEGNGTSSGLMEVEVVRTPTTPSSGVTIPVPLPTQSVQASPMETGTSAPEELGASQEAPKTAVSSTQTQIQPSILVESLKHLTPLLTITSRVGRSLAELMSLLVRLSTSPLHRTHRRGAGHALIMQGYLDTSKEAMDVCLEITNLLADSLCWEVPMPHACSSAMESPIRDWLFAGMTFKMYAVDFCELLLYDEQKQAYHMMLSTFQKKDALKAFIHTFHMALRSINKPSDSTSVYGSCVDFLEAWLNLAEKLVNAAVILESTHALPVPPPSHTNGKKLLFNPLFNPLGFVIQAQKAVFPCLTELWQSPQLPSLNPKIIELLIATVRHFYSSEKLIGAKVAEFLKLEGSSDAQAAASSTKSAKAAGGGSGGGGATGTGDASQSGASGTDSTTTAITSQSQTAASSTADTAPSEHPGMDPVALQQLLDMGFSQDNAAEALVACGNSFTLAMDWILNQQRSLPAAQPDAELSEEEQIMRAIALSLGQDAEAEPEPPPDNKEQEAAKKKEEEEKKAKKEEEEKEKVRRSMEPLDKVLLDDFSDLLLPGCLRLAATVSESVYRVCDLISALAKRNGGDWRAKALEDVSEAVLQSVTQLSSHLQENELSSMGDSQRDSVSCHLLLITLLMEEMPVSCARVLCQGRLLSALVKLLHITQIKITAALTLGGTAAAVALGAGPGTASSPQAGATPNCKWLAPLLLLLDMWEKTLVLANWTREPKKDCTVVWQWFDNTRWCSYSQDTCATIEKAYQDGETSISVRSVRQRMDSSNKSVIYFGPMVQCTNDTTSNRPVLRLEIPKSEPSSSIQDPITPPAFQGLIGEEAVTTIRCCTRLILCSLDPDTLHSNLRMCLRLTRTSELAVVFSREGGPAALLVLTRKSCFRGIASLVTLIFKHCLELGPVLRHAMESVVRAAVTNPFYSSKEIRPQAMGSRELNYVLRKLGPCAVRHPRLFLDIVTNNLQLCSALPPPSVYTSTQRIHPTLVKCVSSPSSKLDHNLLVPLHFELIQILVNQLCAESSDGDSSQAKTGLDIKSPEGKVEEEGEIPRVIRCSGNRRDSTRHNSYRRQLTTGTYDDDDDLHSEDMVGDTEDIGASRLVGGSLGATAGSSCSPTNEREAEAGKNESWHDQPLLSKAAVLRLLSELVETYPFCAQVISEASRTVKVAGQPAKEMTVLSFVFDYLLPTPYTSSVKIPPVAKLSKTFIQSLAVSHPSPETIAVLVTEFKQALNRALILPESTNKHNRVRALTGLLSQISENFMAARGSLNPSHFVRLLIRRGFISDLARAIHSLNLSSSLFHGTANSILKPLEVLTKMVNQVAASGKRADGGSGGDKGATQGESSTPGTSHTPPVTGVRGVVRNLMQQNDERRTLAEQQATPLSGGNGGGVVSASGDSASVVQEQDPQQGMDESAVEPSLLEATHESLIPLEEEEEEEVEEEGADDHVHLVDHVMNLARDLTRSHRLGHPNEEVIAAEVEGIMEELTERMETGDIAGLPDTADITFDHPSGEEDGSEDEVDSEEDEDDDDDDDDEDMMEDDRYNSAGEEVDEEDEYDNSHSEVHLEEEEEDDDDDDDDDDDGSVLTDAPSSTQEDAEEPESSSTEMEDSDEEMATAQEMDNSGSAEAGAESEGLYMVPPPTTNATGTEVAEEPDNVDGEEAGRPAAGEDHEEEEEEEEDVDEDEEEEDELDLEYSYDDEDEDDRGDDLHMDIPPWGLRDEFDFGLGGESSAFPSFFSRAYHTRISQLPTAESDHHVSMGRSLPQFHPLLVRHSDHPQQVASRAIGTSSSHSTDHISQPHLRGGAAPHASSRGEGGAAAAADPHQHESVMQQLLSNISAAAGTNDVLGFGVGTGTGTQRNRDSQSVTTQPSDAGLESTQIPTAYSRWQEESNALDGHAPNLSIATLREVIVHRLSEAHKKEKGSKPSTSTKTKTASPGGLSAIPPAPPVASSATATGTSTTAPVTPHPSDQATPSSRSPRDVVTSSVEQLRSSLRQVADALAQTVAAVRTTREQLREVSSEEREGGSSAMEVTGESLGGDEQEQRLSDLHEYWRRHHIGEHSPLSTVFRSDRAEDQEPSAHNVSAMVTASGEGGANTITTSSTRSAAFPTFDGSQESAAATLANTDPNDPMHTFLSAIVRAPPPPLLSLNSTTTSASSTQSSIATALSTALAAATTATTTAAFSISSTPRFVTFAQFLQQHPEETAAFLAARSVTSTTSTSTTTPIPVAVIQDSREAESSRESGTTADSQAIAEELVRAYSQLVPSHPTPIPATTLVSSLGMPSGPQPTSVRETSTVTQALVSSTCNSTTHSPSPSDTLAPLLMSSLQMPVSSSSTTTPGTSSGLVMDVTGVVGATAMSPSPLGTFGSSPSATTSEVRTPQEQAFPVLGDDVAALSSSLRHLQHWQLGQAAAGDRRGIPQAALEAVYGRLPQSNAPTQSDSFSLPTLPPLVSTSSHSSTNVTTTTTGEAAVSGLPITSSGLVSVTTPLTPPSLVSAVLNAALPVTSISSSTTTASAMLTVPSAAAAARSTATSTVPTSTSSAASSGIASAPGTTSAAQAQANLTPIDPTFLEALPDAIRQEVVAQHEREQRLIRARQETSFSSSISPEFLAALPPNIQEEVLQQERLEYTRQHRDQTSSASAAPDAIDNETFFLNLPPDLRRNILSDMDDSLITHLPERMRTEAQALRQERDTRRRQILEQRHAMLERMMEEAHLRLSHGAGGSESRRGVISRREADLFTPGSWTAPVSTQGLRYAVVNVNPHMLEVPTLGGLPPGVYNFTGRVSGGSGSLSIHHSKLADQNSKQMLDQEALACLLVLLFLDQNKLHNNRLHRIIRNLSQHSPTRAWILSSLLTIIKEMRKTPSSTLGPPATATLSSTCPMPPSLVAKVDGADSGSGSGLDPEGGQLTAASSLSSSVGVVCSTPVVVPSQPQCAPTHWLDMSINAALGSHAKIFQFVGDSSPSKGSLKGSGSSSSSLSVSDDISSKVSIHPLAATTICHNVLDLLVFLGRHFGSSFLPSDLLPRPAGGGGGVDKANTASATNEGGDDQKKKEDGSSGEVIITNFWQILLKLDSVSGRKGKGSLKGFKYSGSKDMLTNQSLFSNSILGQLMALLSHEIIKSNPSLVDKLLRTLSIASNSIPKVGLKSITTKAQGSPPSPQHPSASGSEVPPGPSGTGVAAALRTTSKEAYSSDMSMVAPPLLQNVVAVLISGRCTEEGLEDATTLLTNLSKSSISTREAILFMLLDGVRTIGRTLCSQIAVLLEGVSAVLQEQALEGGGSGTTFEYPDGQPKNGRRKGGKLASLSSSGGANALAGIILPSTGPDDQQHIDHSHDLHIPAMEPLTCKGSQQSFFVRMLKVVCQLRESAQQAVLANKTSSSASTAPLDSSLDANTTPTSTSGPSTSAQATGESGASQQAEGGSESMAVDTPSHTGTSRGEGGTMQLSPSIRSSVGSGSTPSHGEASSSQQQQQQQQQQNDLHRPEVVLSLLGDTEGDSKPSFLKQTLSLQLELEELWSVLSECLDALSHTEDPHAVFVLQPTVEAFFLVHANYKEESSEGKKRAQDALRSRLSRISSLHGTSDVEGIPSSPAPFSPLPGTPGPGEGDFDPFAQLPPDTAKFLKFAEKHRTVLNQILRQSTIPLADGPFAVLVNYTKHLDFDIKRRHFRHELERMDEGLRREDIVLHLRRDRVFEDSFREFRRPAEELKGNLYIQFEGEEGQDVGGLLREWYLIIAREMFNPNYALFQLTPGDHVTYVPNPNSNINPNHLDYFKFIGRVIAKAIFDNKLLDCYFTRSFYKHILGKQVHYTDMEVEDYSFYQGMVYLLEHDLNESGLDFTFSVEVAEFGQTVTKDLIPNGRNISVTETNKREYVQRACNMKMKESIKIQIDSFLKGFYDIIPKDLISIFNEQELELLISGLPTIDIDDLKANTEYHKYTESSLQIIWFWRALRSFDQADRANFLQFVTGTSKVPLTGFASLEGMNGVQKFQIHRDDRSTDRLPCAHTCFNQLDLPPYETYDKLRHMLLTACTECPEGFGFA